MLGLGQKIDFNNKLWYIERELDNLQGWMDHIVDRKLAKENYLPFDIYLQKLGRQLGKTALELKKCIDTLKQNNDAKCIFLVSNSNHFKYVIYMLREILEDELDYNKKNTFNQVFIKGYKNPITIRSIKNENSNEDLGMRNLIYFSDNHITLEVNKSIDKLLTVNKYIQKPEEYKDSTYINRFIFSGKKRYKNDIRW